MTDESQNALLKVLEEPPDDTIFILISSLSHNLLPTILSRAKTVFFLPISRDTIIQELIKKRGESEDRAMVLARYTQGSLSSALQMDGDLFFKERTIVHELLHQLTADEDLSWATALNIFLETGQQKSGDRNRILINRLRLLSSLLRDMELIGLNCSFRRVHVDLDQNIFNRVSDRFTGHRLKEMVAWVEQSLEDIDRNMDVSLTIENLFIRISSCVKPPTKTRE
jgi:DNA polymerase-3 subunit delta'